MLQTMIVTIVAIPFALGLVAAIARRRLPDAVFTLLAPLLAVVVYLGTEGMPAFPPVRAAHKLPYVLAAGGVVLALAAIRMRRLPAALAALAAAFAIALPAWWMGGNILANNGVKLATVAVLALVAVAGTLAATVADVSRSPGGSALPQAIFATSLASALVAILGGYMGMAMFNGGLAALAGGYVLVVYVRHLRGEAQAFHLVGAGAFAFAWVAFMGLVATAILAPKASAVALVCVGLTLATASLAPRIGGRLPGIPAALRPLLDGLVAAIPALAGILIAGLQFAG